MILEQLYRKIKEMLSGFNSQTTVIQNFLFGELATADTLQEANGAMTGTAVHNNTDVALLVLVSNGTIVVSATNYTVKMAVGSHYETPYNSKLKVTAILVAGATAGDVAVTTFFNNNNRS